MAIIIADRVRDTTPTNGNGNIFVTGTAPVGFRTFSAVCSTNDTFKLLIANRDVPSEWEVSNATYVASNQIARTTIEASSNGGMAVNFSNGTKDVALDCSAAELTDPTFDSFKVNGPGYFATGAYDFHFNEIYSGDDEGIVTHWVTNLYSEIDFGGTAQGARYAIWGLFNLYGSANTGGDIVGVAGWAQSSGNNGGTNTGAGAKGTLYGHEATGWAFSGATNYLVVSGGEADAFINTGASAAHRWGWSIPGGGQVRGALSDGALQIAGTGLPYTTGVLFSNGNGGVPTPTNGTLFGTDGSSVTTANAMDFSTYTFTGNIFNFPNFKVTGAGAVVIGASSSQTGIFSTVSNLQANTVTGSGFDGAALFTWRNDNIGANLYFNKSRGTTAGSMTVVQNTDTMATVNFSGSDGTSFQRGSFIAGLVDGTVSAGHVPGRLVFFTSTTTTADGVKAFIDSPGNLVVGNYGANDTAAAPVGLFSTAEGIQINSAGSGAAAALGAHAWANSNAGSALSLLSSRGGAIGTHAALSIDDKFGILSYGGLDGTSFFEGARIDGRLDASSSAGIVPGRLGFWTSNASGVLTEGLRIDHASNIINMNGAIATTATDGFIYLSSCAGAPTGAPTAYTGSQAMIYDTTNHKLWVRDTGTGTWKGVVLT